MKKERRHELQKNELVQWVGRSSERIKPYGRWIGLGALLVVVLVAGIWWWNSRSKAEEAERQTALAELTDPVLQFASVQSRILRELPNYEKALTDPGSLTQQENMQLQTDLARVAEDIEVERIESLETEAKTGADDSLARRWAALTVGVEHLKKGNAMLFDRQREQAVDALDKAIAHFQDVIENSSGDEETILRERAAWFLAAAYQARDNDGDLDKARRELKGLAEGTYFSQAAADALKLIDGNPEFFAMFKDKTSTSPALPDDEDEKSPFRDSSGNLIGPEGDKDSSKNGGFGGDSAAQDFGKGVIDGEKQK